MVNLIMDSPADSVQTENTRLDPSYFAHPRGADMSRFFASSLERLDSTLSAHGSRKSLFTASALLLSLTVLMLGSGSALAAPGTETWTGATDNNWNQAGNWTGSNLPPLPGDTLIFGTSAVTSPNNDYTAGTSFGAITFSTGANAFTLGGNSVALTGALTDNTGNNNNVETINLAIAGTGTSSLVFGSDVSGGNSIKLGATDTFGSVSVLSDSTTANKLDIGANTLNVTGAFNIGGGTVANAALTITGAGGTVNMTNTASDFFMGGSSAGTVTPTIDMSGLSNLNFSTGTAGTGNFRVGYNSACAATLTLASVSNTITCATFTVGDSNGKNGRTTTLNLNGTTSIQAGTVTIGNSKGTGNVGFLGGAPIGNATTPALKIRGQNGTARPTINLGTGTSGSGGGNTTLSFNGHYVDVQGGTLNMSIHNGSGTGNNSATVNFDDGVIDVNSIIMSNRSGTGSGNATTVFNVGSVGDTNAASLLVGTGGIAMAGNADTAVGTSTATLNVLPGGTVQIGGNVTKTTATGLANISLQGGTLDMTSHAIGTATIPIDTLTYPTAGNTATLANLGGTGITTISTTSGGLAMTGAGTLILAGSNPFTGGTSVSNGTLRVNGTLTGGDATVTNGGTASGTGTYGNVNVQGGIFTAGGANTIGSVTAANLNFTGGNVKFKFSGPNADLINLTGTSNLSNSQIAIGQLAPVTSGSYRVFTSAGPLSNITLDPGPTTLITTIGRTTYAIDNALFMSDSSKLTLDVAGAPATVKWTGLDGTNPTNWDNSQTAANWQRTDGGTSDPTHFYDADNVAFDGTNSGASISISGTVTPNSMAVTAGTYTIGGGQIAGTGPLTVSGTANLTLSGLNTMSGAVNVNGGTLNANTSQALGLGPITVGGGTLNLNSSFALSNNPITLNSGTLNLGDNTGTALGTGLFTINGGTLDNTSGTPVIQSNNPPMSIGGSFTFTGAADGTHDLNMGTGAVALTASPTITVAAGTLTIDGTISGAGKSLTKDGNGTLVLDNSVLAANNTDNSYSGGAIVNAGILQVTRKTSGRTPLGSGNTTVNAGATLVGGNLDAFGFSNGVSPATIFINGGTVTDLANSSFRITLRDINFTGGTLTSDPTNAGGNDSGGLAQSNYSLFGGTIETNAATSTAVISAANVALQNGVITFTVAPGNVTGGATPGVDLLVSSSLINWHPNATTTTNGSINKLGGGVTLLTGNSTYTGATTVTEGTLRMASTTVNNNVPNSAAINVNSGGTLDVSGVNAPSQTPSGFTVASGQTLSNNGTVIGSVDAGPGSVATGTGTYGAVIVDGGIFTAGTPSTIGTVAASTLTINTGSVQFKFSGSNADLITLAGSTNLTNAGISINQLSIPTPTSPGSPRVVLTSTSPLAGITAGDFSTLGRIKYSVDSAALASNELAFDITGGPAALKWTGADSADNPAQWNSSQTDANWIRTDGGTSDPTHFYDLDNVVFDGTNTGPSNLTISGTVSPGSINVTAGTYSFGGGGNIAGSGSLTVGGTGSLTITTDNTSYTGPVNVAAGGILRVADPNVNGGFSGSLGTGTINVDGTLVYSRGDSVTLANVLSGAGTIHQAGTGTLILAASNNFSGSYVIDNGTLQAGNTGAFDTLAPASVSFATNVPSGTSLALNGFSVKISGLNTDPVTPGGAIITNGATTAATITVSSAGNNTFGGVLQDGSTGKLNLTVTGGGTMLLTGTNTFTGLTTISGSSTIQTAIADNLVGLAGQVNFITGTLHITGDPNNPGTVIVAANTANKFSNSGNAGATGTFNIDAGDTFQVGASATQTTAVLQTAGTGPNGSNTAGSSFIKTGGGTMIIYGQNNQQDTTFRLQQGTIDLRSARGLGGQDTNTVRLDMSDGTTLILDADPGFNNVTVPPPAGLTGTDFLTGLRSATSGGTLNVTVDQLTAGAANSQAFGAIQAAGPFTMNVTSGPNMTSGTAGLFIDQNPAQTGGGFNGGVALSGDGTFNVVNNATTGVAMQMTINGAVTGTGFGIIKNGSGTLTFDSASTYTGTTTVNNGTLRSATAVGTIGTGSLAINAAAGITSTVSLANTQSVASLTVAAAPTGTAVVDVASGATLTVSGATSVQGTLSKTSAGTLIESGTSALANGAAVQVNGGTLRVNVSGSSVVGTSVTATVAAAGTLELDGLSSSLTDATTPINRAHVANDGVLAVGNVAVAPATAQQVGGIDGAGITMVADNSQLTADHIVQNMLVIGATGSSPSLVTIAASDANGGPLASSGGGLAPSGTLSPSAPFGSAFGNDSTALAAVSDGGSSLGGAASTSVGSSSAVPEPGTLLLSLLALASATMLWRHRSGRGCSNRAIG
jgi:autotransporter-associated beta strand protein